MVGALNPLLGFAAGALTILSPCVLPLVPIVLGTALQQGRWGPWALSAGLVVTFTTVGMIVATLGVSAHFDGAVFAQFGAVLLILAGLALVVPSIQALVARLAGPLTAWAGNKQGALERRGLAGQAGIGALLGLVWSPCVGPTLGAATVLAAQGKSLGAAALVMFAFALGIAVVLIVLTRLTRTTLRHWRGRMVSAGGRGKMVLGGLMALVGLGVLTGTDHLIEGALVSITPDWLNNLTTRF